MSRKMLQRESTALFRTESDRNMARTYRVALWPDLFGVVPLGRAWGRIGRPGRLRLRLDTDLDARAVREAMATRVAQKAAARLS